jgi:hypothetical protein
MSYFTLVDAKNRSILVWQSTRAEWEARIINESIKQYSIDNNRAYDSLL